jgi:tRNA pseudouridine38-40 synthase
MPFVKMTLGYDGTDFYGSQAQRNRRTVQAELESTVRKIGGGDVRLSFAGRTDRGVHALGQVVSGQIRWSGSLDSLKVSLNAVCPNDIVVSDVHEAEAGFHARFKARWREYRYRIVVADVPPVLERRYVWWRRKDVDSEVASRACKRLIGTHGFGSFASGGKSQSLSLADLTRTVYSCSWHALDWDADLDERRLELRIAATGFLPQMVRNIAGAVIEVASGAQPVEWIDELLAAGDRGAMREGAPPQGLILWRVGYTEFDSGCQA